MSIQLVPLPSSAPTLLREAHAAFARAFGVAVMAASSLILGGAVGRAARRQGLASAFGARFDMETDAIAIAVLAVTVVKASAAPPWVLAIGAMRYLYLAVGRLFPVLRLPLPACPFADRRRK